MNYQQPKYLTKNEMLVSKASQVTIFNCCTPQFHNEAFETLIIEIINFLKANNNPYSLLTTNLRYGGPLFTSDISFRREYIKFNKFIELLFYMYNPQKIRAYENEFNPRPKRDELYEDTFGLSSTKFMVIKIYP